MKIAAGMPHPPLLPWHIDAPHRVASLGDLALESGETIEDFRQSYVTHGVLDAQKPNAILVCSAITGTHHRLDFLIGAGKALDPDRWFIIAADAIGNGLSTSPSISESQPGMRFPKFTIRDMIEAQRRFLAEELGIARLAAVVGASMGGMQAVQWAVSYPEMVGSIVAMTAMARTSAWTLAVNEATRSCLMADPCWDGTAFSDIPERGWRAWINVQRMLVGRTAQSVDAQFADHEELLGWTARLQREWLAARFDAHDFLYQSWAYDAHDVGATPGFHGDAAEALRSFTAPALVLAPPLDLYNPVDGAKAMACMLPNARYVEIPSIHGHNAAAGASTRDIGFINETIRQFLA